MKSDLVGKPVASPYVDPTTVPAHTLLIDVSQGIVVVSIHATAGRVIHSANPAIPVWQLHFWDDTNKFELLRGVVVLSN
jgi:hypothetical protein